MRLVVLPAVSLGLAKLTLLAFPNMNFENILLVSFLATITPSAATVVQFAQIHKNDEKLAVAINVLTTLVSLVTMPLFVALYLG